MSPSDLLRKVRLGVCDWPPLSHPTTQQSCPRPVFIIIIKLEKALARLRTRTRTRTPHTHTKPQQVKGSASLPKQPSASLLSCIPPSPPLSLSPSFYLSFSISLSDLSNSHQLLPSLTVNHIRFSVALAVLCLRLASVHQSFCRLSHFNSHPPSNHHLTFINPTTLIYKPGQYTISLRLCCMLSSYAMLLLSRLAGYLVLSQQIS